MVVGAVPDFERYIGFCQRYPDDLEICPGPKEAAYLATHRESERRHFATMQKELGRWGNTEDPRVKAAFAEAPFSMLFDRHGLASIDRPVFLYYAQDSRILPPPANALHIAPLIRTLVGIEMIPHADHFVFLSPCSAEEAERLPEICKDPPGVDRVAVHRKIDAGALCRSAWCTGPTARARPSRSPIICRR